MINEQATDQALTGLRVLDLTAELGGLCTRLLAGMGADVLRIEPPGGHPLRRRAPFVHDAPHPERSLYWFQLNAGKRSITLDPATADGRALFRALAATADLVVESLPVGEIDRLGLSRAALAAVNQRLSIVSVSPYGREGPLAAAEGGDLIGMAAGGLMYLCGDQDRPPVRVTVEQGNAQAGIHAAVAAMVAHAIAVATGEGVEIDVSMQEAVVWTLANNRILWPATGAITHRAGGGRAGGSGSRLIYAAKDGYLGFMRRPESHVPLQRWLQEEGVALDIDIAAWQGLPVFGEGGPPPEDVRRLEDVLAGFFAERAKGDLYVQGQGRGLVLAEVSTARDLVESAHLHARGFFEPVEHPELGQTLPYPGAPGRLSRTPWSTGRRPPLIGEHNIEIYCGELGLSRADLAMLKSAGAI